MANTAWLWRAVLVALSFCALTSAAHAQGRWLRAESDHFIVYTDADERTLRGAVASVEGFDTVLRRLTRPSPREYEGKLELYLLRQRGLLFTIAPQLSRDYAGVYYTNPEIVAAFATMGESGALDAQLVIFHEYAHHFMLANFVDAYPGWYVEGFAEFVQTVDIRRSRAVIGDFSLGRVQSLVGGRWVPINDFLRGNRAGMNTDEIQHFYAQAWLATHYIQTNSERNIGFQRYLAALSRGGDPIEAFEPAFGITPDAFQEELRTYVRGSIQRFQMQFEPMAAASVTVTRMPDAANELLPLVARMRVFVADDQRAALAAQINEIAARYPDDPYALRAQARAALMMETYPEARAFAERAVAADANEVEGHYLLGQSYFRVSEGEEPDAAAASAAQGRRNFARAFRLNADHVPTLYAYVKSYWYERAPLPEPAIDVLIKAHLLAPQVSEISVNAAIQLMAAGEYGEAAQILRPIANSPHRDPGEGGAYLRRLLEAAENGRPPPSN